MPKFRSRRTSPSLAESVITERLAGKSLEDVLSLVDDVDVHCISKDFRKDCKDLGIDPIRVKVDKECIKIEGASELSEDHKSMLRSVRDTYASIYPEVDILVLQAT